MERMAIDILGVCEVRWPNSGKSLSGNYAFYYSEGDKHQHGVGIIVNKRIESCITGFIPYSERVMLLQISTSLGRMNILQVYAPTAEKNDDVIELFYSQINDMLKLTKEREITIIMGDFNANIGHGKVDDLVGEFGLGVRNERGDRLLQLCTEVISSLGTLSSGYHLEDSILGGLL